MKCPACGNDNRDGAKFCSTCRAPLQVTLQPSINPPVAPPPIDIGQPLPGEPDLAKLLALLPELDIRTSDLQIPLPEVDVQTEIERLTQFNLDEQINLIRQLEQQIKQAQNQPPQV